MNPYLYTEADPVNWVDPWGLAGERDPAQELEPIRDPLAHIQAESLLKDIHNIDPS